MITEFYKFADHIFEIEHEYEYFSKMAKDYLCLCSENAIKIKATKEDAEKWKATHKSEDNIDYPLFYLETLVIQSKVADVLSKNHSFVFHGSTIYLDDLDNAYIFTAPSGTGKSTHSRLLKSMFLDRINYVNDDKPFIRFDTDTLFYNVYGSPWDGKERRSNNVKARLRGIFIVNRSLKCSTERLSPKEAINHLIKQIHIPSGLEGTLNGTEFIVNLCKDIPIYILNVDMSEDAPKTSYEIMNKKEGNY